MTAARSPRDSLATAFAAAVAAVEPGARLAAQLPPPDDRPTRVIAIGKAAAAQLAAFLARWPGPVPGLLVVPDGTELPVAGFGPDIDVRRAGHPVPDARSLAAGERALAIARAVPADGRLVVLLSGGGSALAEVLAQGIDLPAHQALTRTLLAAGADIHALNGVRRKLSLLKGGRLAAACGGMSVWLFALSDVPGDDLADIASGPCSPDPVTLAAARATLAGLAGDVPAAIAARLAGDAAAPLPATHPALQRVAAALIGRPADALRAAAASLAADGFAVTPLGEATGPAVALARDHAGLIAAAAAAGARRAFVSGGETTVAVRHPGGRGGRNTTYLLALALHLPARCPVTALAADTDGIDGRGGHAGAFLDQGTLARAMSAGVDPAAALARDDSAGCFAAAGDLFVTGPTGTNVNDLRIVLTGTA